MTINATIKGAAIGAGAVLALGGAVYAGHALTLTSNSTHQPRLVSAHHTHVAAKPTPSPRHHHHRTALSPALLPELVAGDYSGMQPTTLEIGANNDITDVTWQSWGTTEAVGTGQQLEDNCEPDCASGTDSYETVTITLSGVEGASATNGGHYTQITEVVTASGQAVNNGFGSSVSSVLIGAAGGQQGQY